MERLSLSKLKSYSDIVIKDADKGSGVVIMDRSLYVKEALRQLSDESTYRLLDNDPTPDFLADIQDLVIGLEKQGVLTEDMCKFALSSENKPARFYLLPKVPKPGVPGRPVVSTCGSITRNLSVLVDSFLKPLIPTIPSYIRDTKHFL